MHACHGVRAVLCACVRVLCMPHGGSGVCGCAGVISDTRAACWQCCEESPCACVAEKCGSLHSPMQLSARPPSQASASSAVQSLACCCETRPRAAPPPSPTAPGASRQPRTDSRARAAITLCVQQPLCWSRRCWHAAPQQLQPGAPRLLLLLPGWRPGEPLPHPLPRVVHAGDSPDATDHTFEMLAA